MCTNYAKLSVLDTFMTYFSHNPNMHVYMPTPAHKTKPGTSKVVHVHRPEPVVEYVYKSNMQTCLSKQKTPKEQKTISSTIVRIEIEEGIEETNSESEEEKA